MSLFALVSRFEHRKLDAIVALRNTLGVVLAIAIAVIYALPPGQKVAIILGAMFVSNADRSDPYRIRGGRMLSTSLLCCGAAFLGLLSAHHLWITALLSVLAAFTAGMVVVVDQASADLGVLGVVSLVLFAAQPPDPQHALAGSLFVLAGGLIQTVLSIALWPTGRYRPEEQQLGRLLQTLAEVAVSESHSSQVPPASEDSTAAQAILSSIARDSRPQGSRYRSLLSQAERIRLNLISLSHLRRRLLRENGEYADSCLASYLEGVADFLSRLGADLIKGDVSGAPPVRQAGWENFAALNTADSTFEAATQRDVLFHMQTLDGQLRAAAELAHEVTPLGQLEVASIEQARPWSLRFGGTLATLRANFNLQSQGFRHALRLAAAVAFSEWVMNKAGLIRPYWLPMTVVLVLKPEFASTISRSILRIGGTILGLTISTWAFDLLPHQNLYHLGLFLLFTFFVKWLGAANYGVLALCVSGQVVVLLAIAGVSPSEVMIARSLDTILGGIIALAAYWLWPSREKDLMTVLLANLLDSYRVYFRGICGSLSSNQDKTSVDGLRWNVRAERSRFGASAERYLLEKTVTEEQRRLLAAISASSNRFAHATIALETGHHRVKSEQKLAFDDFVEGVETLLDHMATSLRQNRPLHQQDGPRLRAIYIELERCLGEDPSIALVRTMDRITNSLTTLSEQISSWVIKAG